MTDLVKELTEAAAKLTNRSDQYVAADLLEYRARKGFWTEPQERLVKRLIERTKPQPERKTNAQCLSALTALFDKASSGLKSPKMKFHVGETEWAVRRAKAASKNPGFLYITKNGEYRGKVSPDGTFFTAWGFQGEEADNVMTALVDFSKDPAGVAAAYGRETGHCCFCSLELTDERSVSVGYGPICAEHYGLPWGEKKREVAA